MANKDLIVEKTNVLLSDWCYEGLKTAAEDYLAALGTDKEAEAEKAYIDMLEYSIEPIDDVIGFFSTPEAKDHFGEERAKAILEGAKEAKANGAVYCNCRACTAALDVYKLLKA